MADQFFSKYIEVGNKVEIWRKGKKGKQAEGAEKEIYESQVYDFLPEDRIEITMPMEKTKIVLLPTGAEYDLRFYSSNGIYQCKAKIAGRSKKNNVFLLIMELTSNLRRNQRREFYRFSCALEMGSRALDSGELMMLERDGMLDEMLSEGEPLRESIIVDISGGGLRFIADHAYDKGNIILCRYRLETDSGVREYEILGKVLGVEKSQKRPGVFEHRVQYVDIDDGTREEIIKFIFETERKNLKKIK